MFLLPYHDTVENLVTSMSHERPTAMLKFKTHKLLGTVRDIGVSRERARHGTVMMGNV
jgi:hypothetical protein